MPPAPPLRSSKGITVPYDRPIKLKKDHNHAAPADATGLSVTSQPKREGSEAETKSGRKKRRKSKSRSGSAVDGPVSRTPTTNVSLQPISKPVAVDLRPKTKEQIFAAYAPKASTPLKATLSANKSKADPLSLHKTRVAVLSDSKEDRQGDTDRLKRLERQLAETREEGKKRERIVQEKDEERRAAEAQLKIQVEQLERDLERQKEILAAEDEKHREALEQAAKSQKDALRAQETIIEDHDKRTEALREALSCHVCFETLNDPHILHCGHVACRDCLIGWFSTPGAYVHTVPDPIPADFKLAYRTKLCHVCRATVTRRPARMYHLQAFLQPLGLDANMPSVSQQPVPGSENDPWIRFFPVMPEQYRIKDEIDNVWRCPECHGEIMDGICEACDIQFSDEDEYDEFDEDGLLDWDQGGDGTDEDQDPDEDELGIVVGSSGSEENAGFGLGRRAGQALRSHARRAARRRPRDIEGDVEMTDGGSDVDRHRGDRDHIFNVLDLLAEEDSDADADSEDHEIGIDGEEGGSDYDSDDEDKYGGSFIDDGSMEGGSDVDSASRDGEGSEVDGLVVGREDEYEVPAARPVTRNARRGRQTPCYFPSCKYEAATWCNRVGKRVWLSPAGRVRLSSVCYKGVYRGGEDSDGVDCGVYVCCSPLYVGIVA